MRNWAARIVLALLTGILCAALATAQGKSESDLFERGYSLLPVPQVVNLTNRDFPFGGGWRIELGPGVSSKGIAVETLKEDLRVRYGLKLASGRSKRGGAGVIKLSIAQGSVPIGSATDADRKSLLAQAYRLTLAKRAISVEANGPQGLFYGVQTLVQLLRPDKLELYLPVGQIVDWPDLELRVIYWDDAHHLDRMEKLKEAVRNAAFFKANGFAIKLEGHFRYRSAPAIVEPYALTPAQFQDLTRYALRYYVQLIPYLDGPAHDAFILKHPEYAKLCEFPESDYEFCVTNPDTYKTLFGMYDDLLAANRGGKYFFLSTDEPYYVGLVSGPACDEAHRAAELGSRGKLLAEFITKAANYLHDRGRTVLFWGEYPLKPEDISALPSHLINGETYGPEFDPVFKARGIRQMVYTSTQGEEPLFPDYFTLVTWEKLHDVPVAPMRVKSMMDDIHGAIASHQASLMGVVIAAWADAGLHPETFWAGYASGLASGWHPNDPDPREPMGAFFHLYYGPDAVLMPRVYQLMSQQAQFWDDSWDWEPTSARKPIFGNSDGVFDPPRPAWDQTLPLPPVPSIPDLDVGTGWKEVSDRRIQMDFKYLVDNGELIDLLKTNLKSARWHHYNLEVFLSIAEICGHNLRLIMDVGHIYALLQKAHEAALQKQPEEALARLDEALEVVRKIREDRNRTLRQVELTWYKSWYPRVEKANGRRFLHELDDVKDHRPDRTVDMSYLFYRELILPMGDWVQRVEKVRNHYAAAHGIQPVSMEFDWTDMETIGSGGALKAGN